MPREVSDVLKRAVYGPNAGERVFLPMVEIDHEDLDEPLRFVDNGEPIEHGGNTYSQFQFDLVLPEVGAKLQQSTVQIQNVHRDIVNVIRTLTSPPDFRVFVVLDDDPERIEAGPWHLKLSQSDYDDLFVEAEITGPNVIREPYPADSYNAEDYPAL